MVMSWKFPASVATVMALLAGSLSGQEAGTDNRGPTLEDLFTVKSLGSVEVAPDGHTVLYTVNNADLEENETDTQQQWWEKD